MLTCTQETYENWSATNNNESLVDTCTSVMEFYVNDSQKKIVF